MNSIGKLPHIPIKYHKSTWQVHNLYVPGTYTQYITY